MDDEKRSKERWERAVERTLKSLDSLVSVDGEAPHPEPEALAAYVAARLRPSAVDRLSSHLAVCVRCSSIVLALARDEWPDDGDGGLDAGDCPDIDLPTQLRSLRARLDAEAVSEPVGPVPEAPEPHGDLGGDLD